jgi:SpoVK/Ycf46/Vps4 family AAA+-type ATPase
MSDFHGGTSALPGPRPFEARFLAVHLVPFVVRAADALVARRGGLPEVPDLGIQALHDEALRVDSSVARIIGALGLDPVDLAILAVAAAPYLDPDLARRYRELQGSLLDDRVVVGFALELLGATGELRLLELGRFHAERPLFRDRFLTLEQPSGTRGDALVDKLICVPQATIDMLLGWPRLDEQIRPFCVLEALAIPLESVILPERKRGEVLGLVRHHEAYRKAVRQLGFARAIPYGRGITILFAGPPGTGKTLFARALAHAIGKPLLRVHAERLADSDARLELHIAGLFREATLLDAVLFFDDCEGLFSKRSAQLAFLLSEFERFEGITLLATNAPQSMDDAMDRRIVYRMDFEPPGAEERLQIWELHLPPEAPISGDVDLPLLAGLFAFTGGVIKNAVLVALNRAIDSNPRAPEIDMAMLRAAAESQLKFNLENLAHKSRISLTMRDLVLPPGEQDKIHEIILACKSRELVQNKWGFAKRLVTGRGLCLLFDGPPGTGKTLCAEILANELDRAVYRINVANVMSKWMGETEKNIAEIFSRAKATQAILLFDEADSLFAKRTEVQTSNDRFANQEVNLLLQEVERFDGIVILTTNFFGGLDDALKRRIQYRVTFPKPTAVERRRIWRTLTPREAPLAADVDFEALAAAYEFSGGNIKNAVLRAAYRAAGEGVAISMDHLVAACRRESESSGMLFREIVTKPDEPELSLEQIEKLSKARQAWQREARSLLAAEGSETP